MNLSFAVILEQTKATVIREKIIPPRVLSIFIPSLQCKKTLDETDQNFLMLSGINDYIKENILDILREKEDRNENIEPPRNLDNVLKLLTDTDSNSLSENNSSKKENLELKINVNFEPAKKSCHCCEKTIPYFVGTTIILEALLGTALGLFQMEYLQGDNGLIKMDQKTNIGTSIALSSLSLFYMLWQIFTSGEIIFLKDTGAMLDKKFSALRDWMQY